MCAIKIFKNHRREMHTNLRIMAYFCEGKKWKSMENIQQGPAPFYFLKIAVKHRVNIC